VYDLVGAVLGNGHYRIDRKLGSGGQGTVYKGTHLTLNIPVAIKVLPFSRDESTRKRFAREAQRAATLRHANIVGILDYAYDIELDTYYIISEFIQGTDMKKLLEARGGPLPLAEVCRYATQVGAALQFAHSQNIVHRDIKPSNVLVEERTGRVVLCDFGLARMIEGEDLSVTAARGTKPGTPAYMSPEQCLGDELDHRTDIYSFGIVLYEMLVGTNPFRGVNDTSDSIRYKHVHEAPPPPRTLNPALSADVEAVLLQAIEKKPNHRFQSTNDLVGALSRAMQGRGRGLSGILPWVAVVVAAALIVLVIGAFAGFGPLAKKEGSPSETPAALTEPRPTATVVVVGDTKPAPTHTPTEVPTREPSPTSSGRKPTSTLAPTASGG
jgi:serine/threonine-protein kinase